MLQIWLRNLPQNAWANWATGGPSYSRVATRMGSPDWTNAINMLTTTLPGTTVTYYGEEIGMHDVLVEFQDSQDVLAKMAGQVMGQRSFLTIRSPIALSFCLISYLE